MLFCWSMLLSLTYLVFAGHLQPVQCHLQSIYPRDHTQCEWRKTSVLFPCFACYPLFFPQPLFLTGQYSLLRKPENQACSPCEMLVLTKVLEVFLHKVTKAKQFLTLHMFIKNVLSHSNTFYFDHVKCKFFLLVSCSKEEFSNPTSFIKWLLFTYCNGSVLLLPHT